MKPLKRRHKKKEHTQHGIALIIVLWMMVIMSVLILSFSTFTKTELSAATAFKNDMENKFLAAAGIERGIMEICYRAKNKNKDVLDDSLDVITPDGRPYTSQMENGHITIRVTDETGKININTLTDVSGILLSNLLVNLGVKKEEADAIVDSILDWKDKDDLVRLNGAETSYYASLPEPYKAKNSDFESLEELLMIRGMTRDILYGVGDKKGLIHFITIWSGADKVSLNAAPREVLMAIPGMTEDTASKIIELRKSAKSSQSLQDIQAALGSGYLAFAPYVTVGESNIYTIDSTGYQDDPKRGYRIRATLVIRGDDKYQMLNYKNPSYVMLHDEN